MKGVEVISHPLVQHNLTRLRDPATSPEAFRRSLSELTALMVYEATRGVGVREISVKTPLAKTRGQTLEKPFLLVPILRAGLGMLHSILQIIPQAQVGFVGVRRDEKTLAPHLYHRSLPEELAEYEIIVMDPMLATGGSAVAALRLLAERGASRTTLIHLIAAPEGIRFVRKNFPRAKIYTAAVDKCLNERGFIVPGLGDAGDRLFGI